MKNINKDTDLRIIKTRTVLSQTILKMLKYKTKIKVLNICKMAHVTAMTYYNHFRNKTNLLEHAICEQFDNILPIPIKLKPVSLKHLIYYLINHLSKFFFDNKDLIINCVGSNQPFQMSYFFIWFKYLINGVSLEIKRLLPEEFGIRINIFSGLICGALVTTFLNRISQNKTIKFIEIWNSFKTLLTFLI